MKQASHRESSSTFFVASIRFSFRFTYACISTSCGSKGRTQKNEYRPYYRVIVIVSVRWALQLAEKTKRERQVPSGLTVSLALQFVEQPQRNDAAVAESYLCRAPKRLPNAMPMGLTCKLNMLAFRSFRGSPSSGS